MVGTLIDAVFHELPFPTVSNKVPVRTKVSTSAALTDNEDVGKILQHSDIPWARQKPFVRSVFLRTIEDEHVYDDEDENDDKYVRIVFVSKQIKMRLKELHIGANVVFIGNDNVSVSGNVRIDGRCCISGVKFAGIHPSDIIRSDTVLMSCSFE